MTTDIKLLDNAINLEGDVAMEGTLTAQGIHSKSSVITDLLSISNPKYIPTTEVGPLRGLRLALSHSEGDVLSINTGKLYKGGVSIDGTVKVESDGEINIGAVKIKPGPLAPQGMPITHSHSLTICSDTIVFETKSLIGRIPLPPPTKVDLLAVISHLQQDVEDLKQQIEKLKSGGH